MKPANNAPLYVGMYKQMTEIARANGYALAVHGSVARDFDLIAIPWIEEAKAPQDVIDALKAEWPLMTVHGEGTLHPHGRLVYTLVLSFDEVFIDLGFMPLKDTSC